eukprot:CAMPEP_0170588756 /NCGR_PEP_ID=MMETSP0224-20130122/11000_1 /TAXON_ID=285029 /ORGANISM="Togula jolla, Strain CCCM 725" /LENGTH=100 /DNA_ID=CAMNT_0010912495 /DNA_START=634 /DNA_END=936 /DNA_ORIENTATION=-
MWPSASESKLSELSKASLEPKKDQAAGSTVAVSRSPDRMQREMANAQRLLSSAGTSRAAGLPGDTIPFRKSSLGEPPMRSFHKVSTSPKGWSAAGKPARH